jgi:putative transcriptional regulator
VIYVKKTIAELRGEMDLTQRELATQLSIVQDDFNFSPAAIALYELGLRTPSLQKAKLIAKFFGVRVEDIIFGPDACNMQATKDEQAATSEAVNQ